MPARHWAGAQTSALPAENKRAMDAGRTAIASDLLYGVAVEGGSVFHLRCSCCCRRHCSSSRGIFVTIPPLKRHVVAANKRSQERAAGCAARVRTCCDPPWRAARASRRPSCRCRRQPRHRTPQCTCAMHLHTADAEGSGTPRTASGIRLRCRFGVDLSAVCGEGAAAAPAKLSASRSCGHFTPLGYASAAACAGMRPHE
jgi:hypothetical protein